MYNMSKRAIKRPKKFTDGEVAEMIERDVSYAVVIFDDGEEKTVTNFDGDEILDENDSPLHLNELFIGMKVGAKWHGNVHYEAEVKSVYISEYGKLSTEKETTKKGPPEKVIKTKEAHSTKPSQTKVAEAVSRKPSVTKKKSKVSSEESKKGMSKSNDNTDTSLVKNKKKELAAAEKQRKLAEMKTQQDLAASMFSILLELHV